jgi:hypothetical protein
LVFALALVGSGDTNPLDVFAAVADTLRLAAWPALAILATAAGLGVLARPLLRGTAGEVEPIVGLSVLLTASQALGWLGLTAGPSRQLVALLLVGVGLCLYVADRVRAAKLSPPPPPPGEIVPPRWVTISLRASFVLASAVILVAALSPPGWLWSSEFGGYDSLSYHLQLPQEWLRQGKLAPLDHNVYSFLPSYMESVYLLIAALIGAPSAPAAGSHAFGLAAGIAQGAIACQLLHAGMAIWCARALTLLAGRIAPAASALTGPLFISLPWVIVVGSLAYNEMPMLLLTIGAISCSVDAANQPIKHAALGAWLVGIAASVKPTALFLGAPVVGITLLAFAPRSRWPAVILASMLVGTLSLLPWMIRNDNACRNPVFPELTSLFTSAHWSGEQVARYARSHHFDAPLARRLMLTFVPDEGDPAGARHRGLLHPQWALLFPAALVALTASLATIRHAPSTAKRWAIVLSLSLAAQFLAWLFFTHIQSRFLLPLAPVAVLLIVALAHSLSADGARGRGLRAVVSLATLLSLGHACWSTYLFTREHAGHPNTALIVGAGAFTGESIRNQLPNLPPNQRDEILNQLSPEAFVNLTLPHDARLWLLGDATPFYLGVDVIYNTTYDTSPMSTAVNQSSGDVDSWARSLRALNIQYVLVNFAELDRLRRSGFAAPAMTPENAEKLVSSCGVLVHAWPEQGRALYKLRPQPPAPAPGTTKDTPPSTPAAPTKSIPPETSPSGAITNGTSSQGGPS